MSILSLRVADPTSHVCPWSATFVNTIPPIQKNGCGNSTWKQWLQLIAMRNKCAMNYSITNKDWNDAYNKQLTKHDTQWRRWHIAPALQRRRGVHALSLHAHLSTVCSWWYTHTSWLKFWAHSQSSPFHPWRTLLDSLLHFLLLPLPPVCLRLPLPPRAAHLSSSTRSAWQTTCAAPLQKRVRTPWTSSTPSQVTSPTSWPSTSSTTHQSPSLFMIPSADQDVDDLTLGEMLTQAYRGQVDYFVQGGVSVRQSSSSVMFDGSGQPDECNSSKAQIRTLLEEQRQTILADCNARVSHHELHAAQAEEERRLFQGQLWQQKLEFREAHQSYRNGRITEISEFCTRYYSKTKIHRGSEHYLGTRPASTGITKWSKLYERF